MALCFSTIDFNRSKMFQTLSRVIRTELIDLQSNLIYFMHAKYAFWSNRCSRYVIATIFMVYLCISVHTIAFHQIGLFGIKKRHSIATIRIATTKCFCRSSHCWMFMFLYWIMNALWSLKKRHSIDSFVGKEWYKVIRMA